jgi:hypothetical protein
MASLKKYNSIIKDIHLYSGLFISPFLILIAISALVLNHNFIDWQEDWQKWSFAVDDKIDETLKINLPDYSTDKIAYAKAILQELKIEGEIANIFGDSATMYIPVTKPGHRISIKVNLVSGITSIRRQQTNFWQKLIWLHKMPGPHNANIRGNWSFTKYWSSLVDFSVISLFFSSISGIILWYNLKNERKMGLIALAIGSLSMVSLFIGLIF